jgi:hypothetical protein
MINIKLNIKQLKKLLVVGMVFSAVQLVAPVSSNAAVNNPTLAITAIILLATGALFIVAAKKQSAKTANLA